MLAYFSEHLNTGTENRVRRFYSSLSRRLNMMRETEVKRQRMSALLLARIYQLRHRAGEEGAPPTPHQKQNSNFRLLCRTQSTIISLM
jgi:hypothetical protein